AQEALRTAVDRFDGAVQGKQGNGVIGVLKEVPVVGVTVWEWRRRAACGARRPCCGAPWGTWRPPFRHGLPSLSVGPAPSAAGRPLLHFTRPQPDPVGSRAAFSMPYPPRKLTQTIR